jgi:hypothetical protein
VVAAAVGHPPVPFGVHDQIAHNATFQDDLLGPLGGVFVPSSTFSGPAFLVADA